MPIPCFVAPLLVLLCAQTHPTVTPGASQDPAHSTEPAPTPTPTTPRLLVATADEVLTITWTANEPRIVTRESLDAASADTRRRMTRGVVHDEARGKVYVLGDRQVAQYAVDPRSGAAIAERTVHVPWPWASDEGDLVAVPGSDEVLCVGSYLNQLFDLERHVSMRGFSSLPWPLLSASIDASTHRIAYVQPDDADPTRARVRFANPPGELDLPDVSPRLVRWHAPLAPDSALTGALPAPAKVQVGHAIRRPTRLAFGSCADEDAGTARVWRLLGALSPDAVVLLGDTPYIDSTDPEVQARRYREFATFPPFADLARTTQVYATWDDHDFGANDSDGRLHGKEHARAAFIAARSVRPEPPKVNPNVVIGGPPPPPDELTFGADGAGVYSSFLSGPVEVFLLDTRWFARTEPSEFDAERPTLLGAAQWKWLRAGLTASRAPYKVLACGMIWNGAVRPNKTDHWGAYPAEFEGLCRFLGEANITGIVLVGGDIHRSRVVVHPTASVVGYDLTELISSPMHGRVIDAANVPHPGLRFDSGAGHVVCIVAANERELRAIFQTPDAILHTEVLPAASLARPR